MCLIWELSKNGNDYNKYMGLNLIVSHHIKSNKIIIIRTSEYGLDNGFNVANCCNGVYYMKETINWKNFIKWFEIK
jgi:hypothetical protein